MLRVALVGCGKIADDHVLAIQRVGGCTIVGVCDHEPLMAHQLGARFGIQGVFANVHEMLAATRPDVVHITTPPQSHFDLAQCCIAAGCHVYLEKPFTVTADEAYALIQKAEGAGVLVTAGHNCQFTPEMLEMRRLVASGAIGGRPVHLESHWPYSLDDLSYVGPLLSSHDHWVRRLPGQLLHNIVSHGISRLAEFLDDELLDVTASCFQSRQMASMGSSNLMDELRVQIRDSLGVTATFCFSTQIKPGQNVFRLYGKDGTLFVDVRSGIVIRTSSRAYKSYLTFVVPALVQARQHLVRSLMNMRAIVRRDLYQDAGMKELIARFYACIGGRAELPIPYREILLTAKIMDRIFETYPRDSSIESPPQ